MWLAVKVGRRCWLGQKVVSGLPWQTAGSGRDVAEEDGRLLEARSGEAERTDGRTTMVMVDAGRDDVADGGEDGVEDAGARNRGPWRCISI
ncbi:hypothetical protein ACLOJK_034429 [Asimina triloba]